MQEKTKPESNEVTLSLLNSSFAFAVKINIRYRPRQYNSNSIILVHRNISFKCKFLSPQLNFPNPAELEKFFSIENETKTKRKV